MMPVQLTRIWPQSTDMLISLEPSLRTTPNKSASESEDYPMGWLINALVFTLVFVKKGTMRNPHTSLFKFISFMLFFFELEQKI